MHLVLEPNDDRFPKLDIEELYAFDTAFHAWLKALPDLDALDKQERRDPGHKDSTFGLI